MNRYALYTTIYPGIERFLGEWCRSVNSQDHSNFDVWIGIDNVETTTVSSLLDQRFEVIFVHALSGETPVSLRCRAMMAMVARYETIVFTDSDDILETDRVSAALSGIVDADIYGCALGLIDVGGLDLGIYFGLLKEHWWFKKPNSG